MTATTNPLPVNVERFGSFQFPRRACIDQYHPSEKAIRDALIAVESLGADPLLTDAVTLLSQAQSKVADWLEGKSASACTVVITG